MNADIPAELYSTEAEESVIGSILIDAATVLPLVSGVVTPADFYLERCRIVYELMLAMQAAGQAIDVLTVRDRLEKTGQLKVVGQATLAHVMGCAPSVMYADHYAGIVRTDAQKRSIIDTAGDMVRDVYQGVPPVDLAAQAIRQLESTVASTADSGLLLGCDTINAYAQWQFDRQVDAHENTPKMRMPWPELQTRGPQRIAVRPRRPGTMATVAAPSSAGKTAFAEGIAEHWAASGFQVAFFHFELNHQFMLDRRMARWSGVPIDELEAQGVIDERTLDAERRMQPWADNLHYVHCSGWTMAQVLARAGTYRRRAILDALVIDYFGKQRLQWRASVNKTILLGDDAEAIKVFCEREGVPALVLAQLSKEGKNATRKSGDDIRDTGEVEDKSNLVITINRPILNEPLMLDSGRLIIEPGKRTPIATIRVDKQTDGDVGDTSLYFDGPRFMFRSLAKEGGA